jgi:hypothetical protein
MVAGKSYSIVTYKASSLPNNAHTPHGGVFNTTGCLVVQQPSAHRKIESEARGLL